MIGLVAGFCLIEGLLQPVFNGIEIGQDQLHGHDLAVPVRIDAAVHMDDILVLKTADHMDDRIDLPDMPEKLVAEPLPLARPLDQTRDIDKFHLGRDLLFGRDHLREHIQTRIRHRHHADIRFNGAERIILGINPGRRQCIKNGRFSNIWQADNTTTKTHNNNSLYFQGKAGRLHSMRRPDIFS